MDDAFVAVAAIIAKERKMFAADFESPLWVSWLVEECFKQEHWLFAYEAYRRGWFPDKVRTARIRTEPSVKFLGDADVTFVNDKQIVGYLPKKLVIYGGGGGGY